MSPVAQRTHAPVDQQLGNDLAQRPYRDLPSWSFRVSLTELNHSVRDTLFAGKVRAPHDERNDDLKTFIIGMMFL